MSPVDSIFPEEEQEMEVSPEEGAANPAPYEVISEWGRKPEESAKSKGKAPSLKGMICVVPAGTEKERLIEIGRELRSAYDEYENINIEVFDDLEAGQVFAKHNVDPGNHRVLSISKHARSGRDMFVLLEGDTVTEIPFERPAEQSGADPSAPPNP